VRKYVLTFMTLPDSRSKVALAKGFCPIACVSWLGTTPEA
jgi:hypothetical protein